MRLTLADRLLHRELGNYARSSCIKTLYGDRSFIDDLDIVNELGGHGGCVNALSWSTSGRLLASGSDDQHLNIHVYSPEQSTVPFSLTTTVATGHTANIFSVKFMPHSGDATLVTCAGDSEVRVFDIEYSGGSSVPSVGANLASSRRSAGRNRGWSNINQNVRHLSDVDTNARFYRSHGDRVKRIVTESSPFLFLSCSEDGEVRQWDLRLPSSAYPAPRSSIGARGQSSNSKVPSPLISYKAYHLDLNTISCSASQPHNIVLGGAHLHCFLHDRRMIGRDLTVEKGSPGTAYPASDLSGHDDEKMGSATRCVRRFAPQGQKKMSRTDNGHVTACKISDANPNEMIASWSGDHIYSFDLLETPDARDDVDITGKSTSNSIRTGQARESQDRKRKRRQAHSSMSTEGLERETSRLRRAEAVAEASEDIALRLRYENGQTEDIPINASLPAASSAISEEAWVSFLSGSQRGSLEIAKSVDKIRKLMFSLEPDHRVESTTASQETQIREPFSSILLIASNALSEMDEVIRTWAYPVTPLQSDVTFQMTLRRNRDSSRRFTQAAGTLARVLGGLSRSSSGGESFSMHFFEQLNPLPNEGRHRDLGETFSYDFLKAILLWLDGGLPALIRGFTKSPGPRSGDPRFPLPEDAKDLAINEHLIPYLLGLAQSRPIPNVDASRFERDEYRHAFESESAAVIAFSHAIKIPLENLPEATVSASSTSDTVTSSVPAQNWLPAVQFWAFKVGRGLLLNAGEDVNFQFVDIAYGGSGTTGSEDDGRLQDEIPTTDNQSMMDVINQIHQNEDAFISSAVGFVIDQNQAGNSTVLAEDEDQSHPARDDEDEDEEIEIEDLIGGVEGASVDGTATNDLIDDSDGDDQDIGNDSGSGGFMDDDGHQYLWHSTSDRVRLRESVEVDVPCIAHERSYRGHCNVKTVKDVNYFGLQDEYVVSGSDSGHVFIWDKKTSQLLNILEGDGEVVNVVQGHPYEPLLAVSGIDHTVKIFSPDRRAQHDARCGINLGTSSFQSTGRSSLRTRLGRARAFRENHHVSLEANEDTTSASSRETQGAYSSNEDEDEYLGPARNGGLASRKCMHNSYQIVIENDVERQGGVQDARMTTTILAQMVERMGRRGPIMVDENCTPM